MEGWTRAVRTPAVHVRTRTVRTPAVHVCHRRGVTVGLCERWGDLQGESGACRLNGGEAERRPLSEGPEGLVLVKLSFNRDRPTAGRRIRKMKMTTLDSF